jgi:prophage regulatory protein
MTATRGQREKPFGPDRPVAPNDRLLKLSAVAEKVSLTRAYLYELMADGRFPKPVRIGAAVRYSEIEVNEWIAERRRERDAASAPHETSRTPLKRR